MSLASRAVALLQKQYEVIFNRMRQCQWSVEFGAIVSMLKDSVGGFHVATRGSNRQCSIEALEPRLLMTTLYWDPSSAAGLDSGDGAWSTTVANWNTSADGAGSRVAWTNGADAVFTVDGQSAITISSSVTANSITFSGTGYTVTGGTLTLIGSAAIRVDQDAAVASVIAGSVGLSESGLGNLTLTGTNTYTGTTTISSGSTLQIGSGGTAGSISTGAISDNGTLVINQSDSLTMSNVISGSGRLVQAGTGTLILTGASTYSGTTSINSGILQIGAGSTAGSIATGDVINNGQLSISRSNATIFANNISGTGSFAKAGAGDLTLSGVNTFTGSTNVNGGNLIVSGGSALSDQTAVTFANVSGVRLILNDNETVGSLSGGGSTGGHITLNSYTLSVGADNTSTTFAGLAAGTGGITKLGSGTLIFTGANTYTGATTINGGTLQIGAGGTAGSISTGAIVDYGTLVFNNSDATTVANVISGTGNLVQAGAGTLTLTGANTYSGTTTISSGTLQVGAGSTVGMIGTGAIIDNGILTIYRSDAVTLANNISGTGALAKLGAGALTLSGNNTFTGTTTISAGAVTLGSSTALSDISSVVLANASTAKLIITSDKTIGSLSGAGTSGGNVDTGGYLLTVGSDNTSTTYAGVISGAGSLAKTGTGTLILTGANTYTGTTSISGGTLQIGAGSTVGSIGAGDVTNNGQLAISRSDSTTFANNISGTGSFVKSGAGTLTLTGINTFTGSTTINAGTIQVGAGGTAGTIGSGSIINNGTLSINRSDAVSLSNNISGTGALTKLGSGSLTLSGNNTYSGTTTISAGALILAGGNALLDTGDVTLTNVAGAKLILGSSESIGSLAGGGSTGGNIELGTYTLSVGGDNSSTTYSGVISGTGDLVKVGTGTLTLSGSNTFSGYTRITNGKIGIGTPLALQNSIVHSDASYLGSISFLDRLTTTFGGLEGNGNLALSTTNTGGTLALTIGNSNLDTIFSGIMSGAGRIIKTGTGTLTLTGTNTFTGSTTISSGVLAIGDGGTSGKTGTGSIANSAVLSFNRGDTVTVSNVISGTGSLVQQGSGTLILTGANTYTGTTTISNGTLQIGAGGTAGSISTGAIVNNGTLTFNNSDATTVSNVISGTGNLVQAGAGTLTLSGTNTFTGITTINAGTLTLANSGALSGSTLDTSGAGALSFGSLISATFGGLQGSHALSLQNSSAAAVALTVGGNGASSSFAGALGGLGSLVKVGTGTLVLTGANTYSGNTTISAGAIQIGSGSTTGSMGSGSVVDNSSLIFNRSDVVTVSNTITGTGSLSQYGTGTLILTGNNTYSGITTITTGSLQIGNGGTTGALGTGNIVNNGTLVFNRSNAVTLANVISGNGSLTKLASNTLTLSGANTFSGFTRISNGTLLLDNSLALQNSTLDMNSSDAGALNFGTLTNVTLGGLQGTRNLVLVNNSVAPVALTVGSNNISTIYNGVLSGSGSLQKVGTGTLVLTGNNSYTGVTRVNAGIVQIGNGGTSGTLGTGDVYNSGQLIINRSDDVTLSNVIHNTGILVKSGAGRLIFPAGTNIDGTLAVNANATADCAAIQQTNVVLSAGTTYVLQVNVRGPVDNQLAQAGYRIELRAGNTVLAIDDNSLTFAQNQSLLSTLIYTAPADLEVLGQSLEIWLVAEESGTNSEILFSNIQLSTIALHLIGDNTSEEGATYALSIGSSGSAVPSQFNVEWGDGQSDSYSNLGDKTHTYSDGDANGTPETIQVHFYDNTGALLISLSKPISILNVAPTITITGTTSTYEGDVYALALGPVVDPGQDTIQQYIIDWGDGQTSTMATADIPEDRRITHIYTDGTTAGISHQVFVSMVDEDGTYIHAAKLDLVVYDHIPTLTVSGSTAANEGESYTLTLGEVSGLGYDSVKNYIINWGDGNSSIVAATDLPVSRQINHVYADGSAQGTPCTIGVCVEDFSETYANIATLELTVHDVAPSLTISGATSVDEGSLYMLTLGSPTDSGQDTVSAYTVDWGDGQVTNISAADLPADRSLAHIYADGASGGTPHTIQIGVVDEDGVHADVARLDIVVNDVKPSLSINGAASISEGDVYTLTIGNPTDPGQDTISSYSINWGDGQTTNVAVADIPANRQLTHVYADGANGGTPRTIQLDVVDDDGVHSDVAGLGLVVNDVAPTLTISGASSVERNTTYTLNLSASDAGTDIISSWNINWGDGSDPDNDGIVGQIVQGNSSAVTHVYNNAGKTYSITATATDKDGIFSTLPVSIRVTIPVSVHVAADGKTAALAVLGTDVDGDSTYTWSLVGTAPGTVSYSDNGTNGSKNTVATFSVAGTYGFQVTITNADHLVTTQTLQITVDQVLTALVAVPATHEPIANGTQQFTAAGYDQFGNIMATQPVVTWNVTGSGYTIANDGLLTTGSTPGSYTVIATSGGVASDALIFSSKITITAPASATLDSDTRTTAELSVSASTPWGGSDLTYQWLAANDSAGYVGFSDNGSSTAHHTIAYFSAAGTYHFLVKITDSLGASTTSEVSITVAQTLTSIHVTSSESAPATNGTQQFSAVALDQFGKSMAAQPSLTWSVSGEGYSISGDGLLTAGTSIGSYSVTASSAGVISNTVSYNTNVSVAQPATATLDASGTYATLAALGTDLLGGSDLTYSWQLTSGDTSHVTLYKDAAATNEALAYFDAAGLYQFTVTISNGNGQSITSSVDVNIAQILTSIVATPLDTAPGANGIQHFLATAYDQFNHALADQPNFTWTVDNSNYSISCDGVLTAPSTLGNYRVTAHSGNIRSTSLPFSQTTTVAVAPAATIDSITHTTVALSVLGADAGGESRLIYTWKLIGDAPADVDFSSNQTNSAKNTTATLSAAGTYQFQVTITNRSGISTTATVSVEVGQVLCAIAAITNDPMAAANGTQQFSAIAYDQFGNAMTSQPALTWGVSGDGYAISSDGLLTAGSTPGSYTVTGSSNGIASNSISYSQTLTQTSAAAAAVNSSGTYAVLHVGATNASGGSNLIYTWSLTSGNANHVSFYDNSDNAARNTLAYFSAAGTYDFLVTITDTQGNSLSSTVSITVDQILTGITITSTDSAPSANGTQQFAAVAYDQFGTALTTQPALSWSVDNAGYTISATGLLTAGATRGEYMVTATSGETVSNTLSYSATLSSSAYGYVNWPTQKTATLVGNASGGSNLTYVWNVTDDAPASVSFSDNASSTANNTTATFTAAGTYKFILHAYDADGHETTSFVSLTVGQVNSHLEVTASSASPTANGTQQFMAVAYDQFGNIMATQPTLNWQVGGSGYSISSSGLLTAGAATGAYSVSVSDGSHNNSTSFSSALSLTTSANAALDTSKTYATLSALATDTLGGQDLTYTWTLTSGNADNIYFEDNETLTASSTVVDFYGAGTYQFLVTISDRAGHTVTSSTSVTVDSVVASIDVISSDPIAQSNGTQQFSAIAYDQFGNVMATQPTFSWASGGNASITSDGLVTTGGSAGAYNVSASAGGMTGNADPLAFAPIVIQQAQATASSDGKSAYLTVQASGMNGADGLSYGWSTNSDGVTFSGNTNSVTATFMKAGTYELTCVITNQYGLSVTSQTSITVNQQLDRIAITSTNPPVEPNGSSQFVAKAYDQFGDEMSNQPECTWTVSGSGNTIDSSGKLSAGSAPGTFTVTATTGNKTIATSIDVKGIIYTPVLHDQNISVSKNNSVGINVLDGDTEGDPEGSAYVAHYVGLVGGPLHGTVSVGETGYAFYTPDRDYVGSDSFTIETYNNDWVGGTQTVTITVNGDSQTPTYPDQPSPRPYEPIANVPINGNAEIQGYVRFNYNGVILDVSAASGNLNGKIFGSFDGSTLTITSSAPGDNYVGVTQLTSNGNAISVVWSGTTSTDRLTIINADVLGDVNVNGNLFFSCNELTGNIHAGSMAPEDYTYYYTNLNYYSVYGDMSGSVTYGDSANIRVQGNVTGNITSEYGDINLGVGGDVNCTLSAGRNVGVNSSGEVSGTITAQTGSITVTGRNVSSSMTANTGVWVYAHSFFSGLDGGQLSSTITSDHGGITLNADKDISSNISSSGSDGISITTGNDFTGSVSFQNSHVSVTTSGNMSGSVISNGHGDIDVTVGCNSSGQIQTATGDIRKILVNGNLSSSVSTQSGHIYYVTAGGSISGNITAATGIETIVAGVDISGSITSTAGIIYTVKALRDVSAQINTGQQNLHEVIAGRDASGNYTSGSSIDYITVGRDLSANITAAMSLGQVAVGRKLSGDLTAQSGFIGTVDVGASWADAYASAGSIDGSTIKAGTYVGSVTVTADPGYDGAISNATITAENGDIGDITAVSGIDVTATALGNIGNIKTKRGDISGSIITNNGTIGDVLAYSGSISADVTSAGSIGRIYAQQDISGKIKSAGNIAEIIADQGKISGGAIANSGSIGNVWAGEDVSGGIIALNGIGDVTAGGSLSGDLRSDLGSIGTIWSIGDASGDITSRGGGISLVTNGTVSGNINAAGTISIEALGNIQGDIKTSSGQILITGGQSVTSTNLEAPGTILVHVNGGISSNATSSKGDIWQYTNNTIDTVAKAQSIDLFGKDVTGTVYPVNSAGLMAKEDVSADIVPACFAAGTRVLLADGSYMPIELMQPGMKVLAALEYDPCQTPSTYDVQKVFHNPPAKIYDVTINDAIIRVTGLHPFYIIGHGWRSVQDVVPGDKVLTSTGLELVVQRIEDTEKYEKVYNIEVANAHTYFVAISDCKLAVLVHNDSAGYNKAKSNLVSQIAYLKQALKIVSKSEADDKGEKRAVCLAIQMKIDELTDILKGKGVDYDAVIKELSETSKKLKTLGDEQKKLLADAKQHVNVLYNARARNDSKDRVDSINVGNIESLEYLNEKYSKAVGSIDNAINVLGAVKNLSKADNAADILKNGADVLDSVLKYTDDVPGVSDMLKLYTQSMRSVGQLAGEWIGAFADQALDAWKANTLPEVFEGKKLNDSDFDVCSSHIGGADGSQMPFTRNWAIAELKKALERNKNDKDKADRIRSVLSQAGENIPIVIK